MQPYREMGRYTLHEDIWHRKSMGKNQAHASIDVCVHPVDSLRIFSDCGGEEEQAALERIRLALGEASNTGRGGDGRDG